MLETQNIGEKQKFWSKTKIYEQKFVGQKSVHKIIRIF